MLYRVGAIRRRTWIDRSCYHTHGKLIFTDGYASSRVYVLPTQHLANHTHDLTICCVKLARATLQTQKMARCFKNVTNSCTESTMKDIGLFYPYWVHDCIFCFHGELNKDKYSAVFYLFSFINLTSSRGLWTTNLPWFWHPGKHLLCA